MMIGRIRPTSVHAYAAIVILVSAVAACQPISGTSTPFPSLAPLTELPTSLVSTAGPTPRPSRSVSLLPCAPAFFDQKLFLYVQDAEIWKQLGDGRAEAVAAAPAADVPLDAVQANQSIVLLMRDRLISVDTSSGSAARAAHLARPAAFGETIADSHTDRVGYSVSGADSSTLGIFDPITNAVSPLVSGPHYNKPIGFSANGRYIYAIPRGGDPEFSSVLKIDTGVGPTIELAVEGMEYAAVSPDDSYLVTAATRTVEGGQSLEYGLRLYDLQQQPAIQPLWIDLPRSPSHPYGLIFSDSSPVLFFVLQSGTPYDQTVLPYGFWSYDLSTRTLSMVAELDQPWLHVLRERTEDDIAVLYSENGEKVVVINTRSGDTCTAVYSGAIIALVK